MPSKKYYTILGIPENATQKDIKKAYRKEALTWHRKFFFYTIIISIIIIINII